VTSAEGAVLNIDFDDVPGAPLHPNCRCDLSPIYIEI